MAYKFLAANTISDLINATGDFAANNGWEVITKDAFLPVLGAVSGSNLSINPRSLVTPNNKSLLGAARAGNIGRTATLAEAALIGIRLALKDPNGAYFHLFGFSDLTGWIDGQSAQSLSFLELWISDGFNDAGGGLFGHSGLAKMGVGGPYRASFEGCHLFTGQNRYNNKLYFNMALEITAGRFEHFSFGYVDTYFNMDCGEFWQGSGQTAGTNSTATYATNTNATVYYSYVNTIWGSVHTINGFSYYDLSWSDGALGITGNVFNVNVLNSALIRYAMPGWGRNKAFLCGTNFDVEAGTASVGRINEFMPPPCLLAGGPVMTLTPNAYSGVSVFTPAYIAAFSPIENAYWGLIGQYPNQRICNLANNNPKDVVIYGNDEWMLFPLASKGATTFNGAWPVVSGNHGVAYRR